MQNNDPAYQSLSKCNVFNFQFYKTQTKIDIAIGFMRKAQVRDKLCEIILFSTMNIVAELHNYNYCLQLFLTWKIMVWQQLYPC